MQATWKKIIDLMITKKLRLAKNALLEVTGLTGLIANITPANLMQLSPAARRVVLSVTTVLTPELHEGRTIVMKGAGGARTFTLPPATGSGGRYRFVVDEVNTSNYVIKVADASDTIDGSIMNVDSDSSGAAVGFTPSAAHDTITLNGSTLGGASIGDWLELEDVDVDQWALRGLVTSTGIPATPFSATV